jgi:hypothetical protein
MKYKLRTIWALRSGKRKARENEFEAGAFRNPGGGNRALLVAAAADGPC